MFGDASCDHEGSAIFSFVTKLVPSDTAPSYDARYLAYRSSDRSRRRIQAIDVFGQPLAVGIAKSRTSADEHELLLLNLRLPLAEWRPGIWSNKQETNHEK